MLAFVSLVFLVPLNSLPASANTLPVAPGNPGVAPKVTSPDTDGDGLSDSVEINGYDADGDGRPEVDYKKMGANPYHKDVFVEMDYMPGELATEADLDRITEVFASLPLRNPDGTRGVSIHLDAGPARSAKRRGVADEGVLLLHEGDLGDVVEGLGGGDATVSTADDGDASHIVFLPVMRG